MFSIISFISRAVVQGVPLLFGSTGEIITQKSGNLNMGIPGVMYVGAICGVIGGFPIQQRISAGESVSALTAIGVPVLCCLVASLLMGLLYCFLTVTLRANQNVTGLAMTTFGVGFGNFFGGSLIKISGSNAPAIILNDVSAFFSRGIVDRNTAGAFGKLFFSYGFLAYVAVIIAIIASYVIKKTRIGLNLRAVGENPATADAAGIDVNKYKYVATCTGCMIAGLGGLYYVMDYASGIWSNGGFGDRGWLAVALVIFSLWRPNVSIIASFLFGGLFILNAFIPTGTNLAIKEIYKMAPYIVTIIVLVISSIRNNRDKQPPASLGLAYFREER